MTPFFFGAFSFENLWPESNITLSALFIRLLVAAIIALGVALLINRLITRGLFWLASIITVKPKSRSKGDHLLQVRRTETFLSVGAAVIRLVVIGLCLFLAWRVANPTNAPIAVIGASTFFIVLGAATIGPLLRDLTTGTSMIVEQWYNVGDHIVVDPFIEMSGVVEQINLRSTKIRALSGEMIWIHNQHIQAVRVTPRGVKTMSVDTFFSDLHKGRKLLGKVIRTMPNGATMIARPLEIKEEEESGGIWRITIEGQTAPGREWLIEDFAVKAITQADSKKDPLIVHGPIVRYTDPAAERQFKHSINPKAMSTVKPKKKTKN